MDVKSVPWIEVKEGDAPATMAIAPYDEALRSALSAARIAYSLYDMYLVVRWPLVEGHTDETSYRIVYHLGIDLTALARFVRRRAAQEDAAATAPVVVAKVQPPPVDPVVAELRQRWAWTDVSAEIAELLYDPDAERFMIERTVVLRWRKNESLREVTVDPQTGVSWYRGHARDVAMRTPDSIKAAAASSVWGETPHWVMRMVDKTDDAAAVCTFYEDVAEFVQYQRNGDAQHAVRHPMSADAASAVLAATNLADVVRDELARNPAARCFFVKRLASPAEDAAFVEAARRSGKWGVDEGVPACVTGMHTLERKVDGSIGDSAIMWFFLIIFALLCLLQIIVSIVLCGVPFLGGAALAADGALLVLAHLGNSLFVERRAASIVIKKNA
jgi:hypothetical protein